MRDLLRRSIVLSLLVLAALSSVDKSSSSASTSSHVPQDSLPRKPLGVYAKVNIEVTKTKTGFKDAPDIDALHAKFRELYKGLLANHAISGISIGAHWDHIQKHDAIYPDGYDLSFLDDAFAEANAANKSVQLIITPGFVSPKWLVDSLKSCDGIFHGKTLPATCGKATFRGFPEQQRDDGNNELPLPWNPVYQQAWADFLRHLNEKYKDNSAFVAIAMAGPIGASDEMILPTSGNVNDGVKQPSGLSVDDTWAALIQHAFPGVSTYPQKSDQVFIDAWKVAIDTFETTFSGITLVLSPDSGKDLPEFGVTGPVIPHTDDQVLSSQDCKNNRTMYPLSCEAKVEVIQYFMDWNKISNLPPVNLKATQVGGLTAATNDDDGNIGIAGVKVLTAWSPPLTPAFLGGAEFDHAVSGHRRQKVGCPTYDPNDPSGNKGKCKNLTVEDAAYNLMTVFFDHTPAAPYFTGTVTVADQPKGILGNEPIHYLEVPYEDVEYANKNRCISTEDPTLHYMTLEELLKVANQDLFSIAAGNPFTPDTTPPETKVQQPTGSNGWYNERIINFNANDDFSGVVRTELSLDNNATFVPLTCDGPKLTDGTHTIRFRSIDLAKNVEQTKMTTVMVDATAPVTTQTTHYVGGKQNPISVIVFLAASDNLSGVARTEYSLDNGSHWSTGTILVLTESGLYTILFRSTDVAGNVEKSNSIMLNVSLSPPS